MTDALLKTKLYMPVARPDLMARPRLVEHLQAGHWRSCTLVSAPAGFGKTTLVVDWIRQADRPTAWISLDSLDSEPSRFLSYVVEALRGINDEIGSGVLELLHASDSSSLTSVLATLINQIASAPDEFTLVLDDYHVITNTEVHEFVESLLDNIPPQMHLVIISRADPSLPLSRLRARGQITEVREADLRLTRDEAYTFFNGVVGIELSPEEIDVLEDRTEGWVAGLQMAALSLRGRDDVSGFVTAFAGDDRHILDFLVDEVLERQSEDVQIFLLRTSVLERLTGGLCNAVTGQTDGSTMLRHLEQANLFIVPLDDKREWYRYHQLFADMLRAKLSEDQQGWEKTAHRRASEWYEAEGAVDEAANHAFEAGDIERAADLFEEIGRNVFPGSDREWPTIDIVRLSASLRPLPDNLVSARPYLAILYAWWLVYSDRHEEATSRLREAERALTGPQANLLAPHASAGSPAILDDRHTQAALGQIAFLRSVLARSRGDFDDALELSRQALSLLPQDSNFRPRVAVAQGEIYWLRGQVSKAFESFSGLAAIRRANDSSLTPIYSGTDLGRIRVLEGRLREAVNLFEEVLERAAKKAVESSFSAIDVFVAMSDVYREWNQLEQAEIFLNKAIDISDRDAGWVNLNYELLTLARLRRAQGDLDAAIDLIEQAEQLPSGQSMSVRITPPGAYRTRLLVASGRLEEAVRWAMETRVTVHDDPAYLCEFEHITLAKVRTAQYVADPSAGSLRDVLGLLDRLVRAAELDGRGGSAIEILVAQALANHASGDITEALSCIKRALDLAEPERYVRIFVDEGEPMREILSLSIEYGVAVPYSKSLLAAFDTGSTDPDSSVTPRSLAELAVPLSAREVEVIRLIVAGETNQEIADHLVIALDTVKRHVTHIYRKLDVGRRPQAIARARELGFS